MIKALVARFLRPRIDSTTELLERIGINDHPINLAFQVAQLFVAAPILFIRRAVAFGCVTFVTI